MPKFDASRLASLIDPIYESAALPQLRRGLLAEFSDALGAAGAFLHGDPTAGLKIICSESMAEALDAGLRTGWLPGRNARMRRELDAFRQGHAIVTESMIFSPWELDHLPFNAEFVTPHKCRSFAAMRLAGEGASSLVLSVQRYIGSEPFSALEIETMRTLLPHMQRAGQLGLRLMGSLQEGLLDALAAFDCGAILLDWRGHVLRLNAKAEAADRNGPHCPAARAPSPHPGCAPCAIGAGFVPASKGGLDDRRSGDAASAASAGPASGFWLYWSGGLGRDRPFQRARRRRDRADA